jgi:hypothetical protein
MALTIINAAKCKAIKIGITNKPILQNNASLPQQRNISFLRFG